MRCMTKPVLALLLCGMLSWVGCSNTARGGAIGAGLGGAVGGLIGKQSDNTGKGAIVGAAVGGVAGSLIGRHMDKEAAAAQTALGDAAEVERVGEGYKITMGSGILFATDSSVLGAEGKANIKILAEHLQKYPDTNIVIEGHTDSDGAEEYNQKLSERRAASVAQYSQSLGVASARMTTVGFGETTPVADNATVAGKAKNRRVEVAIFANEKMKEEAANGKL
jgi:outer membrane protein OmpA-like peptidoglycan-associated protein